MAAESRDHQHQAEVCAGTHQSDYTFKEEDVPGLAEALAEVAYMWEEIAVALRLSVAVRAECREKGKSLAMKLYNVLHTWVVGQHSNAAQATWENLKTALASPLVQHLKLASELEDKLKTSLSLHTLTTSQKKSIFESGVREVLVERYSQCPEAPRGSWPPVVNKKFINLALIETSGQQLKSDYSIRGDADDVLKKKTPVKYEDVFKIYERRKKLIILGRPGSGKTTLVHKLVRDWSAGEALQGAELVFLVSLRMQSTRNSKTLSDILQCFYFGTKYLKDVSDAVEGAQGEKVCFIFDGFDEYFPLDQVQSIISALLDKSYLVNAMIIVTSRPAAASSAANIFNDSYKKIEVFGFSKSQIMEYIKTFPFSSSSNATEGHSQKLQSFLFSHPGVLDLCYLPVNCAIICFIYDTEPDHLPDTQTQIYALFTRLIIIRQLTSRDISRQLDSLEDLEGQEGEEFKKLCSLAFDMTTQSQQVITRGPASSDEAHSLGLVTTDITAGLSGYKSSYSFLHLTLQEFLAAYHLSKLNQEEQMSLIEKYGKTVHMLTVWKFYFGLVNFETGLDRAEKLFHGAVYYKLFRIQCSYEAQQSCISRMFSCMPTLVFTVTLSNYDLNAIAYLLSSAAASESQVMPTHLRFQFWGPGTDKVKLLLNQLSDRALGYLQQFEVDFCDVSIDDVQVLADKLKLNRTRLSEARGLRSLKDLVLSDNDIGDEGVSILAAGLDGNHVLEDLKLLRNLISDKGVSELMKADCHLEYLDLSSNNISDEGAMAIARGLSGNLTLKYINLSYNEIGVTGAEALALVLQGNTLRLKLGWSNLISIHTARATDNSHSSSSSETRDVITQDGEVNQLPGNGNLRELDLSYNSCDDNPSAVISKFNSLSRLDMCYGGSLINLPGIVALMDFVATCDSYRQLKYLYLCSERYTSTLSDSQCDQREAQSSFIVDLTHADIDKSVDTLSLFQALKNYDRVGGVWLKGDDINSNKETISNLVKVFQHDQIDRLIRVGSEYYEVPSKASST